ncbi:MAG TPA: beta-ketoacyl-ACP synthase III [Phycisphaerae bacterium]|nr:beta-ketoacyl-ACP synthase III [Phycisphaerae bacterium]HOJ75693.1 beta-ketoacyl-ACP synthase III [Phycisphaerae bacterium]HOM53166.1 beta-ketoacyl-ACP synthase III [Phycisphaerae bacterium]HON68532.1 beta-ketoacyl-ACP synthase III [Phycisphaerae bacterium]HOQ87887.1 beta-ketoacyl-ACP synthase III [Phycisphaerae bacterium]
MAQRIPMMIRGMGSALPARVVTNADFEKRLDTSDEWIRTRSGIRERRFVEPGQNTLTLAVGAARAALENAGMSAQDLDLIVVATCTPAYPLPSTACFLQAELGCRHIPAFDMSAACSGFVYGLVTAVSLQQTGHYRNVLVVGAETMSAITDFEDRSTCVLLGDGAGAAILGPADNDVSGLYDQALGADGTGAKLIWIAAGGSAEPASEKTVNERLHYMKMKGREVYKFAVTKMQEVLAAAVERAGISIHDVKLVVPHQSNLRIIESAAEKLGLPEDKVAVNIDRYGNTSAASIPLALDEAWRAGRVSRGDWVLLAGFGGGLTWGTALLRL